jgi:hypothetical protein
MVQGGPYYMTVRATNGVGLQTSGSSQPLVVDSTPPGELSLTGDTGQPAGADLHVQLAARDEESGIAGYRYALWRVSGVSDAGDGDDWYVPVGGIVLGGKLKGTFANPGQTYEPSTEAPNLPGVVSQAQSAGAPSAQEQLGPSAGMPWASIDLTELTPPWFESQWVDLQIPSEMVDIDVVITGFPQKGLNTGDRVIVKVWAMNGAGLFEEAGTVNITLTEPEKPRIKKPTGGLLSGGRS